MTYEEWGKEIAVAPKLFDGSSKHVHATMYADWTTDRHRLAERVNAALSVLEEYELSANPNVQNVCLGVRAALEEKP